MEGFIDGAIIFAKVSFSPSEVPLLNGQPTTYGLLCEVDAGSGDGAVDRYFVPWSAVTYLKQHRTAAIQGAGTPPPAAVVPPVHTSD